MNCSLSSFYTLVTDVRSNLTLGWFHWITTLPGDESVFTLKVKDVTTTYDEELEIEHLK